MLDADQPSASNVPADGLDDETLSALRDQLLAEVKKELEEENQKRAAGFQRLLNERDATARGLLEQIEELKTAGLSEDEREQLREKKLAQENVALRQQLELLKIAKDYSDEYPVFQEIMDAASAQDQMEVIRRLIKSSGKQTAAAPKVPKDQKEEAGESPSEDVDLNNPFLAEIGKQPSVMSDAVADRILKAFNRMPKR